MHSENFTEIAKALVKAQSVIVPAVKDAQNPFLKTRYASLNSVLDACRDALLQNGIAVVQSPAPAPEYLGGSFIGLETRLIHGESGQWIASLMTIPLAKPDPQAMGAAISYGRRYALSAMLGIVSEDDNDCETRHERHDTRYEIRPQGRQGPRLGDDRQSSNNLPELSGVIYGREEDSEGRGFITATGNTRQHKETLKQLGFSWSERRSCWYRAA